MRNWRVRSHNGSTAGLLCPAQPRTLHPAPLRPRRIRRPGRDDQVPNLPRRSADAAPGPDVGVGRRRAGVLDPRAFRLMPARRGGQGTSGQAGVETISRSPSASACLACWTLEDDGTLTFYATRPLDGLVLLVRDCKFPHGLE